MTTKNIDLTNAVVSGTISTPIIQGNEPTSQITTGVITPQISSSVQDLIVAVKLSGYGEEAIPDPTLFKRSDDYYSTIDTIAKVLNKVLPDTTTATEVVAKFIQPGKVDTVSITELLTFTWNIVRVYNDTIAATDLITFTWNALRSYSDSITATESKVANIQTYFQADFVQPGYVGTNITL